VLDKTKSRFTESQLKRYIDYSQYSNFEIRARCLSGAFIGARSKSRIIEITLALRRRARNYMGLDLEIDGLITKSIRMELNPEINIIGLRLAEFSDEKLREIKIYLPVSVEIDILSLSIDGDPLPKPRRKILFLGDSITQGMECVSPVCIYPTVTAKILRADFINQGVGGYFFDPLILDQNLPFNPEIITVSYGVNDWNMNFSAQTIKKASSEYFEKLRRFYPDALIFAITPIWTNKETEQKSAGRIQDIRVIIEDVAISNGCTPINGLSLVPHDITYFADDFHPNEKGHLIYGANLARLLLEKSII